MLTWKAVYGNGEILTQYNEDGTENKYKDILRHELINFDLIDENGKTVYRLFLHENQRLIFRRRNYIRLSNQVGQEKHIVYLIGWQMTVLTMAGERNITAINYIYEDGSVSLDDAKDTYDTQGIELLPEEQ